MARRSWYPWMALGLTSGALITAAGACADDGSINLLNDGDAGGTDAAQDAHQFIPDDSSDSDAGQEFQCSADLHQLLDLTGNVIQTCPDDQGCSPHGGCVPACQAGADSRGSIACDFFAAQPSTYYQYGSIEGACFATFVANNWDKPVKLKVSRAGVQLDIATFARIAGSGPESTWTPIPATGLPPGKVAVLFLSHDPDAKLPYFPPIFNGEFLGCPVSPAVSQHWGTGVLGEGEVATGVENAFHIEADYPVQVYDMMPYGGAASFSPSASLLLPSSAWGTNYVSALPPSTYLGYQNSLQIIAAQDNTTIKVYPPEDLPGAPDGGPDSSFDSGRVPPALANVQTTFTLNAGEFIQWQPANGGSGTIFSADKPVAHVAGVNAQESTSSTTAGGATDMSHQMLPPIPAVGSEYAVSPYTTRNPDPTIPEAIIYRITGLVGGTSLTFDPPLPDGTTIPDFIGLGQVVEFEMKGPFVVKSANSEFPFLVHQVMSGCQQKDVDYVTDPDTSLIVYCPGDPDWVNVLSPNQYLSSYVFFTDPSYRTTNLVVTRMKGADGFKDVELDCAGKLTGWKPVGTKGMYEYTNIDLVRIGVDGGTCTNGPHAIKSGAPFGLTVWGIDHYASYAYPAGGSFAPVNKTVVIPK